MKAFFDTSALFKKYIIERGSDDFDCLVEEISEIIVSPIYWIEFNSALNRRLTDRSLTKQQASAILRQAKEDLHYFHRVIWNESLEDEAVKLIGAHHLRSFDSVQLASGNLSDADIFVTSDKQLYKFAKKEFKNVRFI